MMVPDSELVAQILKWTPEELARELPCPFLLGANEIIDPIRDDDDDITKTLSKREGPVRTGEPSGPPQVYPVRKLGGPMPTHITVGRTPGNDLVLPSQEVSKIHAFFQSEGDRWELSDAGSRNGTWVGKDKLESRGAAHPVTLGQLLTF